MAGIRCLCASVDVEGYGRRGIDEHDHVQGALVRALRSGLAAVPGVREQEQGDGRLVIFPPDVDEPAVLRMFLREFTSALARENLRLDPELRIRVRIGLDVGLVHPADNGYAGDGAVAAGRIQDSPEARRALRESPGQYVVIVSEALGPSVAAAFAGDAGWAFRPVAVRVKETERRCLLHVPAGGPDGSGRPSATRPSATRVPPDVGLI